MRMVTEIEDIIFDYFGIIETQYEAAGNHFKTDPTFLTDKDKIAEDIKKLMLEEY